MKGFSRICLGVLCLTAGGCGRPAAATPKHYVLRVAAQDPFLRATYSQLPDVSVEAVAPGGAAVPNVVSLQQGTTDVTVALADTIYLAYTGHLHEASGLFDQLRGMALLDASTLHFLAGAHAHIHSIDQLKGRHVSLGPVGSSAALIAETLLNANGLTVADIRAERIPNPETVERLARGDLDAAFIMQTPSGDSVMQAIRDGARLLDVDGPIIEELRQRRPYLKRILIPKGVYPGQQKPVRTLGVDRVLICRADVDEDVVYRLLQAYFAPRPGPMPPADLDRAPATPIPLHPGAARYYRQRELSR